MKETPYAWVVVWATFVSLALIFGVLCWPYLATVLASPVMFIPFAHVSASARDLGLCEAFAVGLVGLIGVGSLVGFALWFGLSYGSIVSLLPAICMDYFGGRSVASVVGTLYSGAAVGNLLGPVLAGAAFDHSGHYLGVMVVCGVLSLMATWASRQMKRCGQARY